MLRLVANAAGTAVCLWDVFRCTNQRAWFAMKTNRNVLVLVGLVLAQLGIAYAIQVTPELVTWSWQVRVAVAAGIVVGIGAIASLLFVGSFWTRIGWVATATALPPLIAEAISWSDPAYPNLGYMVAILVAIVASLGASITLAITKKHSSA